MHNTCTHIQRAVLCASFPSVGQKNKISPVLAREVYTHHTRQRSIALDPGTTVAFLSVPSLSFRCRRLLLLCSLTPCFLSFSSVVPAESTLPSPRDHGAAAARRSCSGVDAGTASERPLARQSRTPDRGLSFGVSFLWPVFGFQSYKKQQQQ